MAKRQYVPVCSRCEAPFRTETPFCPVCDAPSPWATHEERVDWEVRQWRQSRSREPQQTTRMMLVRTDAGFQLAPVDPRTGQASAPRPAPEPEVPQNGHAPNGPRAANETLAPQPEPTPHRDPVVAAAVPARRSPLPPRDAVTISKKAVALGIALAVGLPLGSQVLSLADSRPEAARRPAADPARVAAARPVPPVAIRSGFMHLSPDAVRYAVVFRNPNRSHAVRDVTVSVSFHDGAGRLVGTDIERLAAIPAGASVAVAGTTAVAARVADVSARISVGGFHGAGTARAFVVRSVRLSSSGRDLLVRAAVSGVRAVSGARAIAVHIDARGSIIGGDVAYVDVPRGPRSATAVISTSGLASRVRRVEVYVVAPR